MTTAAATDEIAVWFDEQAEPVYVRVRSRGENADPAVVKVFEYFEQPRPGLVLRHPSQNPGCFKCWR